MVWSATYGYGFSKVDREDVVQDVFLRLVRNISSYNPKKTKFTTFITVITKRACIDKLREIMRNREDPVASEDLDTFAIPVRGSEDIIDKIHKQQLIDALQKAMAEKLTTEERLVINLFYFKGCSYSQIARIMNQDETWVKNTKDRTKKYLKEILADYGS